MPVEKLPTHPSGSVSPNHCSMFVRHLAPPEGQPLRSAPPSGLSVFQPYAPASHSDAVVLDVVVTLAHGEVTPRSRHCETVRQTSAATAFIETAVSASLTGSTGVARPISWRPAMNSGGALMASTQTTLSPDR